MSIVLDGTTGISSPAVNAGNIVGQVCFFGMTTAPSGFLKCNGAAVSRTTYADLFTAIGTTYGAGDGSTTFALPDMRGEFPRGWDDGRGVDTGRAIGTAQTDQFQAHRHNTKIQRLAVQVGTGNTAQTSTDFFSGTVYTVANDYLADGANGTPRLGAETRSRNVALLTCIKF